MENPNPKPTYFTMEESGTWYNWPPRAKSRYGLLFAIKFDNGWVLDQRGAWRKPEDDKKPTGRLDTPNGAV